MTIVSASSTAATPTGGQLPQPINGTVDTNGNPLVSNPASASFNPFLSNPTTSRVFSFSDGYKLFIYQTPSGTFSRSWNPTSGYGTAAKLSSALYTYPPASAFGCQNGSVVYWFQSYLFQSMPYGPIMQMVTLTWNTGTHTLTVSSPVSTVATGWTKVAGGPAAAYDTYGNFAWGISQGDAWYDSVNNCIVIAAVNTAGFYMLVQTTPAWASPVIKWIPPWNPNDVSGNPFTRINGVSGGRVFYWTFHWPGNDRALYTTAIPTLDTIALWSFIPQPGGANFQQASGPEQAYAGASTSHQTMLDANGNTDIVFADGTQIAVVKRTAKNQYAFTQLDAATSNSNAQPACTYTSASGDLWVFYESHKNYNSGEIFCAKRTSGTWQTPVVALGGDATGYGSPCACLTFTTNADLMLLEGGAGGIYYVQWGASAPPYIPTLTAPTASVITTPTITWTYADPITGDVQSTYQILVKDPSTTPATTKWDSGAVTSALASVLYGGTALTIDAHYYAQVRVKDTTLGFWSSYSDPLDFVPRALPFAAISTITPTGGAATNGSKNGQLNGNTLASATTLPLKTGNGANFTQGQPISVGASPNIDIDTILSISGDTLTIGPTTAPTAALSGTGITGTNEAWAVSFLTPYGETMVGPNSNQLSPANQGANLTNIPVGAAGSGVYARNIYRLKSGGSTLFLVKTLTDNTTTTYSDTTPDASLSSTNPQTTHSHSTNDLVVEADSSITGLTAPSFTATFDFASTVAHNVNAYQVIVYASDGVTILDSTGAIQISNLAAGTSQVSSTFASTKIPNSATVKIGLAVQDATTGAWSFSPLWTATTNFTLPGVPTGLTFTPTADSGYVTFSWTNGANTITNNVYWRQNGTTPWTLIPGASGALITSCKLFPPVDTAYDYAVSGVNAYGNETALVTLLNQTMTFKWGKYAVWLNQLSNLLGNTIALGIIDQSDWSSGTGFDEHEDKADIVPLGRSKPTVNFGKADFATATGRKYKLITDTSGGTTITDAQALATLRGLRAVAAGPILYRDGFGEYRYVVLSNLHRERASDLVGALVTFDLEDVDYTTGPVSA